MRLVLIVARARNGVIGRDNALPWRLPEDLAHFKRTTMGHPIVMGRRTFESIGRVLPGRRNVVLTRSPDWHADGVDVARSLDEALAMTAGAERVFVIGGAQVYADAMSRADEIVATEIDRDIDGDAFFPPIDANAWEVRSRDERAPSGDDALPFAFVHYARRAVP